MVKILSIDDTISVAPQISVEEVAEIAAAEAAGLSYTEIPVTHAGFSGNQVEAMAAALEAANGPVLAYCRSGTRSCNLWALAEAKLGENPDRLMAKAAATGYDLTGIRPLLDALASGK